LSSDPSRRKTDQGANAINIEAGKSLTIIETMLRWHWKSSNPDMRELEAPPMWYATAVGS
jgi:hypothetical protein